jgi:hypothetical protein
MQALLAGPTGLSVRAATAVDSLSRTARQFSAVKRAIYSFDGSRRAFYEWLQREPPEG